ncbi:hypothetical protein BCV69DRAFT_291844 [Microstroma glucosiphilum]|uniref:Uncharacterized protein n=1 Tax=Pseudomicrostroma glucosiphilum TaxID=1684307 RepID=A0A316UIY6_9BASI|nr:hypothetical protein BCV69DRAFT_291844 [Pseudomicrostroma glucosiphilum]PWN23903.1 hypothetical protein BCV69DRAFT_291844 [Pseudomicrostroma glucosiphilum]
MPFQADQRFPLRQRHQSCVLPCEQASLMARRSIDDATDSQPSSKPTSDAPQWPFKYNQGILAGIGVSSALSVLLIIGLCVFVCRKIRRRRERQRLASSSVLPIYATSEKVEQHIARCDGPRRASRFLNWPACPLLCWNLRYRFRSHACSQAQTQGELFSSLSQEERGPEAAIIQAHTFKLPELSHRIPSCDGEEDGTEGLGDSFSFDTIPTPLTVEFALPPGANVPVSSPPEPCILQDASAEIPFPPACETTCSGRSDTTPLSEDHLPPRASLASDVDPSFIGGNASKWDTMPIPGPHLRPPSALGTFPWHIRSPRPTLAHPLPQLKGHSRQQTLPESPEIEPPNDDEGNPPPSTEDIARPDAVYSKWQRLTQRTDRSSTVQERRTSRRRSWSWWERGSPLRVYSSEAPLSLFRGQSGDENSQAAPHPPTSILQSATVGAQTMVQSSRVHFHSEVVRESLTIEAREAPRAEAPKSPYVFWRDEDGDVSIPIELATDGRTRSSSIGSKFVEQFNDSASAGGMQGIGELVRNSSVRSGRRASVGSLVSPGQEEVIDGPQAGDWLEAVSRMGCSETGHGRPARVQAEDVPDKGVVASAGKAVHEAAP